jgi:glutamate synthase domain-containing protein 2
MNPEEVKRKASSGAVRLSSGSPERPLPGLDSLVICPAQLSGTFPADIFEGIETDVVIGEKQAKDPLALMVPVFLPGMPFGESGKNARLGLAYGASLAQTAFGTGEGGSLPEEREICKQFHGKTLVSWGPARYGVNPDYLNLGNAAVMELCGGGRGCTTALWRTERTNQVLSEAWGAPAGLDWVTPPVHLDMEFPEDLKLHISLLRELTDHRIPVIVKLGAARVHEEAKLAVECGADAVWIEALEAPLFGAPDIIVEQMGVPLLAVFGPARKAFEETGAREKGVRLLVSGGIGDGGDVFKALALGADAVGVSEAARIAMGCNEEEGCLCHTGKCPAGIATMDPKLESNLDWKAAGKSVAHYINALTDEVKLLAASCGHTNVRAATMDDLRALTYDSAAMTGVKLAGYDKSLPMWMH